MKSDIFGPPPHTPPNDGKRPASGGAQTVEEFMDTFCKLQRVVQEDATRRQSSVDSSRRLVIPLTTGFDTTSA
jgi:hypothetical protein